MRHKLGPLIAAALAAFPAVASAQVLPAVGRAPLAADGRYVPAAAVAGKNGQSVHSKSTGDVHGRDGRSVHGRNGADVRGKDAHGKPGDTPHGSAAARARAKVESVLAGALGRVAKLLGGGPPHPGHVDRDGDGKKP